MVINGTTYTLLNRVSLGRIADARGYYVAHSIEWLQGGPEYVLSHHHEKCLRDLSDSNMEPSWLKTEANNLGRYYSERGIIKAYTTAQARGLAQQEYDTAVKEREELLDSRTHALGNQQALLKSLRAIHSADVRIMSRFSEYIKEVNAEVKSLESAVRRVNATSAPVLLTGTAWKTAKLAELEKNIADSHKEQADWDSKRQLIIANIDRFDQEQLTITNA